MAHKVYENAVLENKLSDLLVTAISMNNYMTIDNSLTENAGMKKIVNKYTAIGNVEDLAMGEGNSEEIEVSFEPTEYVVETTQGKFQYYDEQEMADPTVVDMGLKAVAEKMTNDLTDKAIAEYDKATLSVPYTGSIDFDTVVDAVALLNTEDETGTFMLINPAMKAGLRKSLKDDLKYNSDFVLSGYIGTVAGVNVVVSKAVPANKAYLATKEAVTCFIKKNSETEQERDADHRNSKVFCRKVMLVALTDATKVVKIEAAE